MDPRDAITKEMLVSDLVKGCKGKGKKRMEYEEAEGFRPKARRVKRRMWNKLSPSQKRRLKDLVEVPSMKTQFERGLGVKKRNIDPRNLITKEMTVSNLKVIC